MSPRNDEEDSGVFAIPTPSLLAQFGWDMPMIHERDRLIRRALEDEIQRLSETSDGAERLALAVYTADQKRFLRVLGETVRWDEVMNRVTRLQQAANVPRELRLEGELWAVADRLGDVRQAWLTGRLKRQIEERKRLRPKLAAMTEPAGLRSCSDLRGIAESAKHLLLLQELRYQVLIKPATAAIKAA